MRTIPLLFTFDSNLSFPASVCLSSILMSANEDTFYDIFILHAGSIPVIDNIEKIKVAYSNFKIQYRSVGNVFDNAFEIRGITTAAYHRLLAPDLIPEYDKIVYADVDMIFRSDLSRVYDIELGDNYLASAYSTRLSAAKEGRKYVESIGLNPDYYFQSGFMLMNLKKLREDNMVEEFLKLAKNKYTFQDMDIINITCNGKILPLSWIESMAVDNFLFMETDADFMKSKYADTDADTARNKSNIHYNGMKPWIGLCPNFDIWWEYYRKSPVFDPKTYFAFFYNKLDFYDQLSLKKRLKILFRFFVYGRKRTPIMLQK